MAQRILTIDWAQNPLGPLETWPEGLRASLGICLSTQFPIALYYGADATLLYNDAWHPILGEKHPWALGQPGREVWSEIWDVVGPVFERVMATGEGSFFKDGLLSMRRFGYTEECYFDYTFSPIRGPDGKIEGVFNAVTETTFRVLSDRRGQALRALSLRVAGAKHDVETCVQAARSLETDPADIPFALFYLLEQNETQATLAARLGLSAESSAAPAEINLGKPFADIWRIGAAISTGKPQRIEIRPDRHGHLPGGSWPEQPREALVLPLQATGRGGTAAVLVLGVSPRRALDESYTDFLTLVAAQVGTGIANARAHQEERERAEALAKLDRAKTEFFSNVSHEFRTPLTLMLGPIEDLLEKSYTDLTPATKNQLEIVHRNSLRLMKLVNTMLDFSRIEAGRVEANFASVDLAAFTAELASVFRAAIERAGLRLVIDCRPLPEPVLVDREMWEKIVFNLLSNAFKFTLQGEIEVRLEAGAKDVQLTVRDTGVGIPPGDLARVFERFHRVRESRGRTHEGTGIGLALVQELVRLHGGTVRVESEIDRGSRFIVQVPLGRAHLDPRRIRALPERAPGSHAAEAFVQEAMRWDRDENELPEQRWARVNRDSLPPDRRMDDAGRPKIARPRVVWADDNTDMRDYVSRLLAERFEVVAVADGEAALGAIRTAPPELVLSDVMMPRLDGFGLVRALRSDPALSTLPIILLSARAGEEARVEGVESGADDYLIKPFSARELLARVESQVKMARFRRNADAALRASEARFRAIVETTPECVKLVAADGTLVQINSAGSRMIGLDSADAMVGRSVYNVIADEDRARYREFNERVCKGERGLIEFAIVGFDGVRRQMETHAAPLERPDGTTVQLAVTRDMTARKQAESALRASEERLRQTNAELAGRLTELQQAGVEIRNSRRAAMNLMQDAILAREQVERLNQNLHGEIAEREATHKRLHQRTAQFETLLNQAPLGVYVVDADFRMRDINPTARTVFGDIAQVIGRKFDEILHILWPADYANELVRQFRHTLETGESHMVAERSERRLDRNVTEYYEWRIDRIPVPDGRFGVVCYFRDISAQVRSRLAIADSEERYRSLVSVVTDVPWSTDASGAFVAPQRSWEAYTGQTWAEHRGFGWANALHPDDRERVRTEWNKACADRTRYGARGRLWHAATQEWRHFVAQAAPLLAADGTVREWTGAHTDCEQEIRAEQQLKVARDDALAANRAKDEFLATLSHELRTPLNPVLLLASDSAEDAALPETVRGDFKMIVDNISLQARLIDDLLDFSRIVHGKLTLERRLLDLHEVVRDAAVTIGEEIKLKRSNLTFSLLARSSTVNGDPVRLRQVFWNVLKNAVKFTPAGGQIAISSLVVGNGAEIEVRIRDSGIGMRTEELLRVFQPFVQGRHHSFGGLGLGLAISRMLLECHGGTISAESPGINRGSTIIVRLPLKSAAAAGSGQSGNDSEGMPASEEAQPIRRILFVEDHEPTRATLTRLLKRRGYEVIAAHSVKDAREKVATSPIDILISDLGLPDGDGCELMIELRKSRPDLPGIVLSGFGMGADVTRTRAAGFEEHLTKPVGIESLDRALARLLDRDKSAVSPVVT